MARYMGPPLSLSTYCTNCQSSLAQWPCVMSSCKMFYKASQGNKKRFPLATSLEGNLHQIQLQCAGRMMHQEAQQHLRDHFFHGVRKHICDSIQYLYSTPGISYSQLMKAAQKVESKNKETQDWVRMRATVATMEGRAQLQHQIAQLMSAVTQTR